MKAPRLLLSVFLLAGLGLGVANTAFADQPNVSKEMLGKKIANLTFKTDTGKTFSLYEDYKNKKAIVLVFLSFDCPVSTSYSKPLADIHTQFKDYGVSIIGLTVHQDQTRAEVGKLARKFDLPFPVVQDKHLAAADAVKALITPEVFVLDGDFVLRYRGRIDNQYYARLKKNHEVSCHDLRQVIGELLSGRAVSNPATEAIGCPIPREEKKIVKDGPVTYHRDVLPILQNKCQTCHRPGEVGPFSLLTYKQAYNWAEDIKTYTQSRDMPPWKPSGDLAFHNERKLTDKEIATLAKWVDTGCPEGNPKDAPPPVKFAEGWQLGEPDMVLEVPADFQLGPSGRDVFRCFVVPTKLGEDKYVTAVEVRPGNPSVVHHSLLFVDTTGKGRQLELQAQKAKPVFDHDGKPSLDKGPGYSVAMGVGFTPSGGLSGWAPGSMPRFLPDGYGYFLPKNSDVIIQVHYHRNGRLEKDRTKIGLYFAKDNSKMKLIQNGVIPGGKGGIGALGLFFAIPPGEANYKLTGTRYASDDCQLYAITPHMHMIGKSIKVTMTPPDGTKPVTLIHIKDWDYNWQESYLFKTPVQVKAGAKFEVEAIYDNSSKNPNNPFSPPRLITFGEQTDNEMCFVFLAGSSDRSGRRLPMTYVEPKKK